MGTCLAHILKGDMPVSFTLQQKHGRKEDTFIVLIVVPILKSIFLLSNFTLMSHLEIINSPFVLLAKALPPFPKPYLISHKLLT